MPATCQTVFQVLGISQYTLQKGLTPWSLPSVAKDRINNQMAEGHGQWIGCKRSDKPEQKGLPYILG